MTQSWQHFHNLCAFCSIFVVLPFSITSIFSVLVLAILLWLKLGLNNSVLRSSVSNLECDIEVGLGKGAHSQDNSFSHMIYMYLVRVLGHTQWLKNYFWQFSGTFSECQDQEAWVSCMKNKCITCSIITLVPPLVILNHGVQPVRY